MTNEKGRPATGRPSEKSAAAKPPIFTGDCTANRPGETQSSMTALSAALRDYGIAKANENADLWWSSCVDRAIEYLAAVDLPFSADHVTALVPAADHPCRMGGRFHAAVNAGIIRPVGYVLSERPARHRGVQRLYRGGASR